MRRVVTNSGVILRSLTKRGSRLSECMNDINKEIPPLGCKERTLRVAGVGKDMENDVAEYDWGDKKTVGWINKAQFGELSLKPTGDFISVTDITVPEGIIFSTFHQKNGGLPSLPKSPLPTLRDKSDSLASMFIASPGLPQPEIKLLTDRYSNMFPESSYTIQKCSQVGDKVFSSWTKDKTEPRSEKESSGEVVGFSLFNPSGGGSPGSSDLVQILKECHMAMDGKSIIAGSSSICQQLFGDRASLYGRDTTFSADTENTRRCPALYVKDSFVWPGSVTILRFQHAKMLSILKQCIENDEPIVVIPSLQKSDSGGVVGTLCRVQSPVYNNYGVDMLAFVYIKGVARVVVDPSSEQPHEFGSSTYQSTVLQDASENGAVGDHIDQLIDNCSFQLCKKKYLPKSENPKPDEPSQEELSFTLTALAGHTKILSSYKVTHSDLANMMGTTSTLIRLKLLTKILLEASTDANDNSLFSFKG
eukprot:TRINITY_DN4116_c0_g3_i1.p1 TRINITY_DN4116_c0_g3~~TRINITY_DN4116_c0_g3_i1.p1  ORF type:complete len:476 (+),score=78.89 TRINITY_DN4116_c0_g3_i1:425-1852(+)